jgi:ketosteroid isomerase-like protein
VLVPTGANSPVPAPEKTPAPAGSAAQNTQAVEATVRAWAAAWSNKDVGSYLDFYAPNFVPPGKHNRSQWERERRARILKNSAIEVRVNRLEVRVAGEHAVARFQQEYRAPTLVVSSAKKLRLSFASGRWRIIKETVIP